jgi:hypothetical protein
MAAAPVEARARARAKQKAPTRRRIKAPTQTTTLLNSITAEGCQGSLLTFALLPPRLSE